MKKVFFFLFLSYFLFFFLIPPFQTPDEGGHFDVIYWVSRGIYPLVSAKNVSACAAQRVVYALFQNVDSFAQNIPNFSKIAKSNLQIRTQYTPSEMMHFSPYAQQAYNPPLYYGVGALFLQVAHFFHASLLAQFYAVRLTSSLFYMLNIFVAYVLLKKFFQKEAIANGILLFYGLNPLLLQSGVGISPDIAAIFFTTWFFYMLIRYKEKIFVVRNIFFVGSIVGFGCLSKLTCVVIIPGFLAYSFFTLKPTKQFLRASFLFLLVVFAWQMPWFIFNFMQYHTPVVTEPVVGLQAEVQQHMSLLSILFSSLWGFRHIFLHFSGFLGWNDIYPFPFIFIPYALLFIIFMSFGIWHAWRKKETYGKSLAVSLGCLFLFFLLIDMLRRMHASQGWEIGGRDALLLLLPCAIFIANGIAIVFAKKIASVARALGYFAIWYYYVILVFVLVPRFYV